MIASAAPVRRVRVEPLSARSELRSVARAAMAIVTGALMSLGANSATFRDAGTANRNLLPFQALVRDRPPTEQRMFRELQEGLLEAEARRSSTGEWPAVSTLAGEGIPPFAFDPTAKGSTYDWSLVRSGAVVNYVGIPRQDAPAWLVVIQEPEPGVPPDQNYEDEEHHRLATGVMLHVSTWIHPKGRVGTRLTRSPQTEGWMQLYAVAPAGVQHPPR
jgi:hypothetical protein